MWSTPMSRLPKVTEDLVDFKNQVPRDEIVKIKSATEFGLHPFEHCSLLNEPTEVPL